MAKWEIASSATNWVISIWENNTSSRKIESCFHAQFRRVQVTMWSTDASLVWPHGCVRVFDWLIEISKFYSSWIHVWDGIHSVANAFQFRPHGKLKTWILQSAQCSLFTKLSHSLGVSSSVVSMLSRRCHKSAAVIYSFIFFTSFIRHTNPRSGQASNAIYVSTENGDGTEKKLRHVSQCVCLRNGQI